VGVVDLFGSSAQAMQHSMGTGIYVRADYKAWSWDDVDGVLEDTAMRLHLGRGLVERFRGKQPRLGAISKSWL